jgi:hypothetical protein
MSEHLPQDLSILGPERLDEARAEQDKRLAPLFRRWPALSGIEMDELRHLYPSHLRLAKHLGSLHKRGLRQAQARRPKAGTT